MAATERTKRVILSDVHIGTGSRYNWYQDKIHWKDLRAVFEFVQANAGQIKDLVLLGDFVDQWCALPTDPFPTFNEIQETPVNVKIFDALRECLAVVENVFYVKGNHDMSLRPEEIEAIWVETPSGPKRIKWLPVYRTGLIWAEHGHRYSMFNAGDLINDPKYLLPIGYFITRLASLFAMHELEERWPHDPTKTVSDLPNTGHPTPGLQDAKWFWEVIDRKASISQAVIDDLVHRAKAGYDLEFSMPDHPYIGKPVHVDSLLKAPQGGYGTPVTAAQARAMYAELWAQWHKIAGLETAVMALFETDIEDSLKLFADRLGVGEGYHVVMMGHTHKPVDTYEEPFFHGHNYVYCNSGFNCPCVPDMISGKRVPTFTEVDKLPSKHVITVYQVVNGTVSVLAETHIDR